MGWQVGDRRFVVHVSWPHSWDPDMVLQSDKNYKPMTSIADAVTEAERWKVPGLGPSATTVRIYEEVLTLT